MTRDLNAWKALTVFWAFSTAALAGTHRPVWTVLLGLFVYFCCLVVVYRLITTEGPSRKDKSDGIG